MQNELPTNSLSERITAYHPHIDAANEPRSSDRWVLASNLQKAIRRGLVGTAVGTAIKLVSIDKMYFWRRLLVIGYEDVGLSDIPLCHELLKVFRREALHRKLGVERVAAYFAATLANARKSRTLCDAIAMLEFNISLGEIEKRYFGLTDTQLLEVACSPGEHLMERVAALRHICGYRENAAGKYRVLAPARTDLMREVCRELDLTDMETTLFLSGQNTSESMNVSLPLVVHLARGEQKNEEDEQSFEGTTGLLYAALDRHTRAGKVCFAKFAREVKPIADFFRQHPELKPVDALGVTMFIVEGSCLYRWVEFPQSKSLQLTFEQNFLEHAGLTGEAANEFTNIILGNMAALNRIRAEAIETADKATFTK